MLKKIAYIAAALFAAFISLIIAALINETLCAFLLALYMIALFIGLPIYAVCKIIAAQRAKKRARRKRRRAAAPATQAVQKRQAAPKQAPSRRLHFPEDFDGKLLAYKYEGVGVYVPDIHTAKDVEIGQVAILEREPDNKFDPGAVAVYAGSPSGLVKVGYLYRGRLQSMANDWLKADEPIFCQFSQADKQAANASKDGFKLNIAFYK